MQSVLLKKQLLSEFHIMHETICSAIHTIPSASIHCPSCEKLDSNTRSPTRRTSRNISAEDWDADIRNFVSATSFVLLRCGATVRRNNPICWRILHAQIRSCHHKFHMLQAGYEYFKQVVWWQRMERFRRYILRNYLHMDTLKCTVK